MIKVPHIIEVDWDLEDVEIDDVIDIETLSEDEIRTELGLPLRVKLPSGLMEELVEAEIEGFEDKYEIVSDYLSDAYGYTLYGWKLIKSMPADRIPLEFKVTVQSARLPKEYFIGVSEYDSGRVLYSELRVWLEKYYGLPKNVSIRPASFNIGFGRSYQPRVNNHRTLDAVFYLEKNATFTKKMQKKINKTMTTKTFRKDTTLVVKLELKDD